MTMARKAPEIIGRMNLRAALGCQTDPWEQDFTKRSLGGQESHDTVLWLLGE